MIPQASNYAQNVDMALYIIGGISLVFLVGITGFMFFCLWRYNKKRHAQAAHFHGNLTLEITWTVIPTIIVFYIFYVGYEGFLLMRSVPKDAMVVKVIAKMWDWRFEYANGKITEKLVVPLNKPVKLVLTSKDVIHSFYVPAFRNKEDVVPGRENYLWFQPTEEGEFDVLCAEYCGDLHAYMRSTIAVVKSEEFESWYASASLELPDIAEKGKVVFKERGACIGCHSVDGSKNLGPTLKNILGRKTVVLENGKEKEIVADEDYIRNSILYANQHIVKGYENIPMLSYKGMLSDQDVNAIIEYLKRIP